MMAGVNKDDSTNGEPGILPGHDNPLALAQSAAEATCRHELSPSGYAGHLVPQATLVVVRGAQSGRVFGLHHAECIVGRSREADISIVERAISSQHALVRRTQDGHELIDLGSTNGTLLNGHRLAPNQRVELHSGDMLQLGECALVYLGEGTKDVADVTQALSVAAPNLALAGPTAMGGPDEILAQILKLSMPEPEPPKVSLDERVEKIGGLLRRMKRQVPLVASIAAGGALIGVASIAVRPPVSSAAFSISLRPEAVGKNAQQNGGLSPDDYSFFLFAENNFSATGLVKETLLESGDAHPSDAVVEEVQQNLSFKSIAPQTYFGTYKHLSADHAVKFLRVHVQNYLDTEIAKTLKVVQKQVEFLSTQAREKENQLRETESQLRDFRGKYGELLPENTSGRMDSLESLRQRQSDLSAQVQGASVAYSSAANEAKRLAPKASMRASAAQPYRTALNDAKVRLAGAVSQGLGESHPEVVRLKKSVAEYERLVADSLAKESTEVETAGNAEVIALKRKAEESRVAEAAASAELGAVSGQIARLEKIVKEMPVVASQYAELTRSYGVNTETHRRLLQELESAHITLNLERASAEKRYQVLMEPTALPLGMRKQSALRAAIGGGAGAFVGVLVAMAIWVRRWLRELPQRRAQAMTAVANQAQRAPVGAPALPARRN